MPPEPGQAAASGADQVPDPAGTTEESLNTETGQGGPPESVPYARFKEVNDKYVPYRDLERLGYDADSLRNLAAWNSSFIQDPVGNWMDIAANLEGMPPELRQTIERLRGDDVEYDSDESEYEYEEPEESEDEEGNYTEAPTWAQDLQAKFAAQEAREAAQADAAAKEGRMETLNWIIDSWKEANSEAQMEELPEGVMLSFIAGAAGTGNTREAILEKAREDWMTVRSLAQGHLHRSGPMPAPRAVPGGAAVTGAGEQTPRTFEEANAAIEANWENILKQG